MPSNKNNPLQKWFQGLEPKKRETVIKAGVVGGAIAALVGFYYLSGQADKKPPPPPEKLAMLQLGDARLEDDVRATVERERQEQRSTNDEQDKKLKESEDNLKLTQARLAAMETALHSLTGAPGLGLPDGEGLGGEAPNNPASWEQAPNGQQGRPQQHAAPGGGGVDEQQQSAGQPPAEPPPVQLVGEIGKLEGAPPPTDQKKAGTGNRRFFLPTSFMPAKLLTGLKAKTVESARGDPEPMLLRIQAPAVLPNEVRAALEGCLVVAHGYGSLASERVEARLVSLSCLDYEGKSLIDTELQGIVVDKDGVKGLQGHAVSKMGANLARLALANAVSGAGEAFEAAASTTSVSPLGQTQSIDPDQIGKAGAGKGIGKGADEYAKIIADLVRQQSPVVEVGPSKDVTIVVTAGTWLEIKAYEDVK